MNINFLIKITTVNEIMNNNPNKKLIKSDNLLSKVVSTATSSVSLSTILLNQSNSELTIPKKKPTTILELTKLNNSNFETQKTNIICQQKNLTDDSVKSNFIE
jgi:hypothetical protein